MIEQGEELLRGLLFRLKLNEEVSWATKPQDLLILFALGPAMPA